MKPLFYVLLGILLAVAIGGSYQAYRWKQVADVRGWKADACYAYLAEPVAKDAQGRDLSRGAVLDAVARKVVR